MSLFDHVDLCRSVIDSLELGVHVVDRDNRIILWNHAAERITGYNSSELLGRKCCGDFHLHCVLHSEPALLGPSCPLKGTLEDGEPRRLYSYLKHKAGHTVPVHTHTSVLHGVKGEAVGAVESFSEMSADSELSDDTSMHRAVAETEVPKSHEYMEAWLDRHLKESGREWIYFGVLQVHVDQLPRLRTTHGHDATEALMRVVSQTLAYSLHSSDIFGRWNENQFLVIAHDASSRALELDADLLCSLSRSVEFRWWGDRVPITVSVGGTMATKTDRPDAILSRTSVALAKSVDGGGNQVVVIDGASLEGASC